MASKTASVAYVVADEYENGPSGAHPVFPIPIAIIVARGFALFFAIVIMGLGGYLMHGLVLSAYAFGFVCGLLTLIIGLYAILTEKVASCRPGYNYWAVLALDLLMIIFWLSSMAANAALRASFVYSVDATCYDDGSTFNSGYCDISKRNLARRVVAVAGPAGRASMSAIAGLSALEMLLFIASFAYLAHNVRIYRQTAARSAPAGIEGGPVEMKVQTQPMLNPQVNQNQPPQQAYGAYTDATQQPQQQQQQAAYGSYPTQVPQGYAPSQTPVSQAYTATSVSPVYTTDPAGSVVGQPQLQPQQQQYYQQ